jgi:hypothetical protein
MISALIRPVYVLHVIDPGPHRSYRPGRLGTNGLPSSSLNTYIAKRVSIGNMIHHSQSLLSYGPAVRTEWREGFPLIFTIKVDSIFLALDHFRRETGER